MNSILVLKKLKKILFQKFTQPIMKPISAHLFYVLKNEALSLFLLAYTFKLISTLAIFIYYRINILMIFMRDNSNIR